MFFATVGEIWKNLAETYSMKQDLSACFELENKVFNTKQGTLSVTDYYGTLNGLWIELDQYQSLTMKCDEDSTALTQFIERTRIFKFLSGLNSEFDPIRVQIFGNKKLSSLSEVFHTVRGDESRRSVMMEEKSVDGSALATGKGSIQGSTLRGPILKSNSEDRWCSYCKKSGHSKDTCFKLHGRDKVLGRISGSKNIVQRRANHTVSNLKLKAIHLVHPQKISPALAKQNLSA
ncbi:unnamed protein product [Cuscuta europaea]|uniref:Retrotransposon gag domain-containing protein n=1 Tax=Cuscuta europaea TaxID=41803 RepID=A0A9P1ELQ7_CUSEU|nr:unnamed protein product [Cuscuta europaea]